jgi:hypothetical protein
VWRHTDWPGVGAGRFPSLVDRRNFRDTSYASSAMKAGSRWSADRSPDCVYERLFASLRRVGVEQRFEALRRSAACAPLSRDGVTELLGITATMIEERQRIRRVLHDLPESFTEVRKLLNALARTVQ